MTLALPRGVSQVYRIFKVKENFFFWYRIFKGKVTNLKDPDPYFFFLKKYALNPPYLDFSEIVQSLVML